ncbi:MAG: ORF6N domain-containing protein [Candidatus Omnitrophica bacterium]|nr:ORF6N domain-containing protein [Candidatus Omnitrophota bacterium]
MARLLAIEKIENNIFQIRDKKVMVDRDLARLYEVETKQLTRQVRRNLERFPEDFMFKLTKQEYGSLRRQIGTLKKGEHSKYLPYVFTEQGVAMLSSVLNSERAIHVNIAIMRAFVNTFVYPDGPDVSSGFSIFFISFTRRGILSVDTESDKLFKPFKPLRAYGSKSPMTSRAEALRCEASIGACRRMCQFAKNGFNLCWIKAQD